MPVVMCVESGVASRVGLVEGVVDWKRGRWRDWGCGGRLRFFWRLRDGLG